MKTLHTLLRSTTFAASLLAAALAQAAPGSAPLQLEGSGPYFRLTLPASLHTLAKDPELSDLRVRNADGLPLPWAWQGEELATPATRKLSVPLFPVPTLTESSPTAAINLRIRADGSLEWKRQGASPQSSPPAQADWIVDTHVATGNLLQLRLQLAPQAQGLFPLSVEGSDDLSHWHPLPSDVAVLQINNAGQTLLQNQIDLGAARARYLRLHWLQPTQAPQLLGAELESFEQAVPPAPALQWTDAWAPQQCDASACTWRLPSGLPVDALRVELAETNTVAPLRIYGESPVSASAPIYHRHRHPLHGLRHREREAAATTANDGLQRSLLADTVVWRLTPGGLAEQTTPALMLDGSHHTQLRIEARHAVSEWGTKPPRVRIGTRSRSIAFLARGAGPLSLAWDLNKPEGAAVSLATLMPAGKLGELGTARVELPAVAQPAAAASSANAPSPTAAASGDTGDHKPWLWAALGVGLLLLGGMAASLLKQIRPTG
ncbi:MAG: DUF3999 family protein [Vitreoscilla sp.]|nr:DUF3999 family protein [Vitreoscilla sp.]